MPARETTQTAPRRRPRQARSGAVVEAILEAAIRVLERDGARRFTTARIAERAGVSVGSLYQYFPNKAAILFRLQSDEWARTGAQWRALLGDATRPHAARLRALAHAFLRSECEEAPLRRALAEAAPAAPDSPDDATAAEALAAFLAEALPVASPPTRATASRLVVATLTGLGERFSDAPRTEAEIASFADAVADMLCAYIERLSRGTAPDSGSGSPGTGTRSAKRCPASGSAASLSGGRR